MKALVIGATGAVGKDLVEQLLKDDSFDRVDVFVRREIPLLSSRLVPHVVDFDHPEGWSDLLTGDVLFSCLDTDAHGRCGGRHGPPRQIRENRTRHHYLAGNPYIRIFKVICS